MIKKQNDIANSGLVSISNLISIQPDKSPNQSTKELLQKIFITFSFLPLHELKNLIHNLIVSINDYNTLSLPIYVKNQLDIKHIASDILIIDKEIRETIKKNIIRELACSEIGDEVKTYNYKQLFDLLFYFLSCIFRKKFRFLVKITVRNIIKDKI